MVDNATAMKVQRQEKSQNSSSNTENMNEMQVRGETNPLAPYGSSTDLKNLINQVKDSDDRQIYLEQFLNNTSNGQNGLDDIIGMNNIDYFNDHNFDQNNANLDTLVIQKDDNDLVENEVFYRRPNMDDFETTQGTFRQNRYLQSCSQINSIIENESKRAKLTNSINECQNNSLTFTKLVSSYKVKDTKSNRTETFISLLHLLKQGKVEKLEQKSPEEFSEIHIYTK